MDSTIFKADCSFPFVQIQSEHPEDYSRSSFYTEFPKIANRSVGETVYDIKQNQYVRVCKVGQICEVIRVPTFIELNTLVLAEDSEFDEYLVPAV
jgi:hypothetical protein